MARSSSAAAAFDVESLDATRNTLGASRAEKDRLPTRVESVLSPRPLWHLDPALFNTMSYPGPFMCSHKSMRIVELSLGIGILVHTALSKMK